MNYNLSQSLKKSNRVCVIAETCGPVVTYSPKSIINHINSNNHNDYNYEKKLARNTLNIFNKFSKDMVKNTCDFFKNVLGEETATVLQKIGVNKEKNLFDIIEQIHGLSPTASSFRPEIVTSLHDKMNTQMSKKLTLTTLSPSSRPR